MTDLIHTFEALSPSLKIFWSISIFSTFIFITQIIMTLLGMDNGVDADTDLEVDGDFSLFSLRSIVAFLLFFGWTGVMVLTNGGTITRAIVLATLSGTVALIAIAYLLYQLYKMEESGTVNMYNAVGQEADVYIPIPAALNGKGKIQVKLEKKIMELTAVTKGNKILTGDKVTVLEVLDNNVLLVEAL